MLILTQGQPLGKFLFIHRHVQQKDPKTSVGPLIVDNNIIIRGAEKIRTCKTINEYIQLRDI